MENTRASGWLGAMVGLFVGLSAGAAARAMDVALKVEEPAGVARVADPCRSGIPLVPGAVIDEKKLKLTDDKGAEVPAQFRVINRRPAGDIEWVCVDFLADVPAKGTAVYHLTDGGPAKPVEPGVKLEETDDAITAVTGPLKLVISKKKFQGMGEVSIDPDGSGNLKFVPASAGGALVIKGVDGQVYRSDVNATAPLKVSVEESGPLHAVIRIDGQMTCMTKDGKDYTYPTYNQKTKEVKVDGVRGANRDGSLGFTVRIHLWKGQSWVRTFVTMINLDGKTNNWTEQRVQFGDYFGETCQRDGNYLVDAVNFDLNLKPAGDLKYRIGGGVEGSEVHSGDLASGGSVVLHQDSSAGWMWQATTGKVFDERLAKNITFMKSKDQKKPYYEYDAYQFELLTRRDGCSFMGYRVWTGAKELAPSSTSSFADLGKESGEGMRAPGWIQADDGQVTVTAGCRWFWQTFPKSLELRAPGQLSVGLWSQYWPRGHVFEGHIHRTHELVFDFNASGKGLDPNSRFLAFSQRLIATPDARHNLASRVYGDFMLPNPTDWPNYEMASLAAVVPGLDPKVNPSWASGMEIEREKCENYDTWKFGDSNKDSWHYFGQYQELDVPYGLMVQYARTGDLRFFRFAEEIDRFLLDIPAYGGGYGHQMGEPSHYYAYGPLLYADAAAEPFLRDAIVHSHRIVHPAPWHMRSLAIVMWSNWALANGFGDADGAYRKGMDSALAYWDKVYNKQTHDIGGFNHKDQVFMLGMGSDAMGRYLESNPADKVRREQLVEVFRKWMKDGNHPDKTTANGFAYAYRFSGDPAFLDFAAKNICVDSKFPTVYRTGVCSAKNWSETVSSQRLIQVFLHDWDKRQHPERYKDLP
ncbi:MAG: hypothetical protein BIFFINMI_01462 [Phycisphaerae bacterium]|nr:hypothetical protein [Phycisphaerae bacterium]